jgi:UDP-glucose 4-epimerase
MPLRNDIVISGANGLLGRRIVKRLAREYQVHAIVRATPEEPVEGARYYEVDLGKEWSIALLPQKALAVIHLAQSPHYREFPEQALDMFMVNVASTARLLDYARTAGAARLIYSSTGGIYEAGVTAVHEQSPILPPKRLGYYFGSKLSSEILAQSYSSLMDIIILRPFFIYGPGQERSMFIPRLVDNVRKGAPITLQGNDGLKVNPIHVDDAAAAVEACFHSVGSKIINLGGPEVLTLRTIAGIIGERVGIAPVLKNIPGNPTDFVADISLMRTLLQHPLVSFKDGVADVL